jgi:hypothetical protein
MEKYAVVIEDDKTKTASEGDVCPTCGEKLESKNPPKCPKHGTEPFEKKQQGG